MDVSEVYECKGGEVTASTCTLCLRCVELCPYKDALKPEGFGENGCCFDGLAGWQGICVKISCNIPTKR